MKRLSWVIQEGPKSNHRILKKSEKVVIGLKQSQKFKNIMLLALKMGTGAINQGDAL